jgi:hypothetical protein
MHGTSEKQQGSYSIVGVTSEKNVTGGFSIPSKKRCIPVVLLTKEEINLYRLALIEEMSQQHQ